MTTTNQNFIYLFIFMISIFFIGCSDNLDLIQIEDNHTPTIEKSDLRSDISILLPEIIEDRYYFENYEELTSFYQSLELLAESDYIDYCKLISSDLAIESVRKKLYSDEFQNPSDRYQPFLSDAILQSILNENFELQIGDKLISYHNNDDLLISHPSDLPTKNLIRTMNKGQALDHDDLPKNVWIGKDKNGASAEAWCGCEINISLKNCDEACVSGSCKDFIFGEGEGTISIYFSGSNKDPQSNVFTQNVTPNYSFRVNGNFEFCFPLNNTNPNLFIHAFADPDCFVNTADHDILEANTDQVCDPEERSTGWVWTEDNDFATAHRIQYYENFWSTYEEAEVFLFKRNDNSWKHHIDLINCTIEAQRRNPSCNIYESESETKTSFWSSALTRVNSGIFGPFNGFIHHCTGDVRGIFDAKNGLIIHVEDELEFHCCL